MNKLILLLLFSISMSAQSFFTNEKDTSFTLNSAYQKIKKEFPFALPSKVSDGISLEKNIEYSEENGRRLFLDILMPGEINEPLPLIIIIHGGGWRSGSKEMEHAIASKLALHNFVVATVECRLSTEALFPVAVKDIKNAIKFLKENGERFFIDIAKIVLMGQSAGGQLASLVGVSDDAEKFSVNYNTKVTAIVDIDGVLDMTTPSESGKDTIQSKPSSGKMWLGYSYKENPQIWRDASPLNYIGQNTPPMLFINSSIPRFHAGRVEAIAIMEKHGIYSEVHTFENTPHTFWLFDPWQDKVVDVVVAFLLKVLK